MAIYQARVKPNSKGSPIRVEIEAKTNGDAKRLLEAQYGKGNIVNSPERVKGR